MSNATETINSSDLGHFTGTSQWYVASIFLRRRFLLTDGTMYLAKRGCHWLFDVVASVLPTQGRAFNEKAEGFSVWRIEKVTDVAGVAARVSAWTDTPGNSGRLYVQDIPYTDFPFDELGEQFDFYVEGIGIPESPWVALLKSEH